MYALPSFVENNLICDYESQWISLYSTIHHEMMHDSMRCPHGAHYFSRRIYECIVYIRLTSFFNNKIIYLQVSQVNLHSVKIYSVSYENQRTRLLSGYAALWLRVSLWLGFAYEVSETSVLCQRNKGASETSKRSHPDSLRGGHA